MSLLQLDDLQVDIGEVQAVRGVSLSLQAGECHALVGESGCGKSITGLSLLDLLPRGAVRRASRMEFAGAPMPASGSREWLSLRGNRVAMIFQNPLTALNPTRQIGSQIAEPLRIHRNMGRREAWRKAVELLERLAIPDAAQRAQQYPFEFSGGMLQRVVIAMAVACEPELLIADEPTTALDLSIQAEVLALLNELREKRGTALLFVTHDLGVVANFADTVSVMYAGQLVEHGPVSAVFDAGGESFAVHPYTAALRRAVPNLHREASLQSIPGHPPDLRHPPEGCAFAERCEQRMAICASAPSLLPGADDSARQLRCWGWHPDHPRNRGGGDD
jgi:oligopeptide/dipeptide ABC transporter ATP-binding protein